MNVDEMMDALSIIKKNCCDCNELSKCHLCPFWDEYESECVFEPTMERPYNWDIEIQTIEKVVIK